MQFLIATARKVELTPLGTALALGGHGVRFVGTREAALEETAKLSPDLVIIDEALPGVPAKEMLMGVLGVDAGINTAIVTAMPAKEFHDFYEGFGVLMDLPETPAESDAQELLRTLEELN